MLVFFFPTWEATKEGSSGDPAGGRLRPPATLVFRRKEVAEEFLFAQGGGRSEGIGGGVVGKPFGGERGLDRSQQVAGEAGWPKTKKRAGWPPEGLRLDWGSSREEGGNSPRRPFSVRRLKGRKNGKPPKARSAPVLPKKRQGACISQPLEGCGTRQLGVFFFCRGHPAERGRRRFRSESGETSGAAGLR